MEMGLRGGYPDSMNRVPSRLGLRREWGKEQTGWAQRRRAEVRAGENFCATKTVQR